MLTVVQSGYFATPHEKSKTVQYGTVILHDGETHQFVLNITLVHLSQASPLKTYQYRSHSIHHHLA
jgi:hypothetical protein